MFCLYFWAIAQIVLESFPISSSGHTVLLSRFCFLPILSYDYLHYVLHIPTLFVVALFFVDQWSMPFRHITRCWSLVIKISMYTALATLVTVFGYAMSFFFPTYIIPLPIGFLITSVLLWSLRWVDDHRYATLNSLKAVLLGIVQAIAFTPGISRFAVTYVAARWMHIPARRAFEISFLIQWPLLICAALYSLYVLDVSSIELLNLPFLLSMLGASLVAYIGLCFVSCMIKKKIMWWWSLYMLIPFALSIMLGVMHA